MPFFQSNKNVELNEVPAFNTTRVLDAQKPNVESLETIKEAYQCRILTKFSAYDGADATEFPLCETLNLELHDMDNDELFVKEITYSLKQYRKNANFTLIRLHDVSWQIKVTENINLVEFFSRYEREYDTQIDPIVYNALYSINNI